MANLPISGLPAAGALTGNELAEIVQGGVNVKTTLLTILALASTGLTAIVQDTAPQLGGTLDAQNNAIIAVSNIQTTGMDFDQITASAANAVSINMASTRMVNLAEPVNPQDAATKNYLDAQKGAANGIATLGVDLKIPSSQLPALAITDVYVVNSEVAQLALVAEEGDVAVRTDINTSFIHNGGTAGDMTDWQELLTPGTVLSVNGYTGAVTLDTDDIAEGATNLYWSQARFDTAFNAAFSAAFDADFANKDASALAFSPTTPGDWTSAPTTAQEALDELAARESGSGNVSSDDITTIEVMTQAAYNGLGSPDANTLYVIVG